MGLIVVALQALGGCTSATSSDPCLLPRARVEALVAKCCAPQQITYACEGDTAELECRTDEPVYGGHFETWTVDDRGHATAIVRDGATETTQEFDL